MNLGKRFAVAFRMAGFNPPAVARLTGIPVATINALTRRDSKRSNYVEQLLAILPAEKVNVEWVRTGQGTPEPINTAPMEAQKENAPRALSAPSIARVAHTNETPGLPAAPLRSWEHENELPPGAAWVFLPRLLVTSEGGQGVKIVFLIEEVQAFRADWVRDDQLKPSGLAWGVSPDESMQPVLWEGDAFVIDTNDKEEIQDGRTYAVMYGGRQRVRRLFALPGGGLRLKPANDNFESFDVPDARAVTIIGRIVRKAGKGGL